MAVNVMEYMNKFQEEGLAAIKQTQETSLKAMSTWRELTREMSEKPGTVPTLENMPTPTQFVEFSFGFASQLLELRKTWTLRMAEMIVEAQKQTEATVKAATANMNQAVNQNLNQNLNQNKPVNPSK
jgi:hypothetical protein